jgi:phosphotransferase system HPr (HPr) family protein
MSRTVKQEVLIQNRKGLHARASAKVVHIAEHYDSITHISYQDMRVPAESIMGLLMLGAGQGACILIESEGEQAEEVVASLVDLIANQFGEV